MEEFNLHTILSLPAGCFLPYTGVKANVIFFNREPDGRKTEAVWYYELTNDGFELKQGRKPIPGGQIPDFLDKVSMRAESQCSWLTKVGEFKNYDLSAQNPNRKDDYEHRPALELVQSMKTKQERINDLLQEIEDLLGNR